MKIVGFALQLRCSGLMPGGNPHGLAARASRCAAVVLICWLTGFRAWSADCVSPPAGLVSWWPGDGNAHDIAGGNNGILGGTADTTGMVGQAFLLDGDTGSACWVPASSSLNLGIGGGLTVEAWINPADITSQRPLMEWYGSSLGVQFWLSTPSQGALMVNLRDTSFTDHSLATAGGVIVAKAWQHVAATYNKTEGQAILYVDGTMVSETHVGTFTPMTTGDVYMGLHSPGPAFPYAGLMDEICLYNRALTAAEIQAIYSAGSAGKCHAPIITSQPRSQAGYWGKSVTLFVTASVSAPVRYQWLKSGAPIEGASGTSLLLTDLQAVDAGSYSVVITNSYGSAASSNACLTVNPPEVEARFFRIAGPTATTITAFSPDGYLTWIDTQPGGTYTVQTTRRPGSATNWVDYIQVPASNAVMTHRLYDPNPPSGMELIPAGTFTMGDTLDGTAFNLPLHTVYVSAFYMDKHEVTKSLWDEVGGWNGGNGYSYENAGSGKAPDHPVQTVNWRDCVKWCNARSEKERRTPCYYNEVGLTTVYKTGTGTPYVKWDANGFRLPTEAEWEKAARGGANGHRFPWADADTINHSRANYYSWWSSGSPYYAYDVNPTEGYPPTFNDGVRPYTSPAGYFSANGYGLHDMAGNVREWCWDWGGSYSSGSQSDPRGPSSGSYRIERGGGWSSLADLSRASNRGGYPPDRGDRYVGFRCVLAPGW
jgi:formylglycine-generating enzyme